MAGRDALCACAVAAGHDLGLYGRRGSAEGIAAQLGVGAHRLRLLLDVLVALGAMARDGDVYSPGVIPPRSEVVRDGWGRLAEVIRTDRPLPLEHGRGYHDHLARAGAAAARELAPLLAGESLLDLGGGAGTYTEAYLDAFPRSRATLVDAPEVIALAAERLARFGDRVTLVAGDARDGHPPHATVLLANVLHLHGEEVCAAICASARRAGGRVVVKDLRVDEDRRGPLEGLLFALGMGVYTDGGDVYRASTIRGWLGDASEHRLQTSDHLVLVAERSPFDGIDYPRAFRRVLDAAVRDEPTLRDAIVQHYARVMPAARRDEPALFSLPLDWPELPRLRVAIARLYAVLADAGVDPAVLGEPTADAYFAATPTLSALYARTHYGGAMPLLYGHGVAYFESHGLAPHALIDRYLVAPLVHELAHLHRERAGVPVVHLDECLAGWLGVHVHRELAYPAEGHDDALYGAPWLSQVGQAFARAVGVRAAIRAHAGVEPLPFEVADIGWADWRARKTLHFLSDTMLPDPWVGLALTGRFAAPDLAALELPPDTALDRAIVTDALEAMCLVNVQRGGSVHPRLVAPEAPIAMRDGWVTTERRGDVDPVAPRYWLPPRVARLPPRELHVPSLAALPDLVAALLAEAE